MLLGNLPPSMQLIGIGFYVGVCIVIGTLGGRELDKLFDTGKLLTILGLALGLALAIWGSIRQLLDVLRQMDTRRMEGKRSE